MSAPRTPHAVAAALAVLTAACVFSVREPTACLVGEASFAKDAAGFVVTFTGGTCTVTSTMVCVYCLGPQQPVPGAAPECVDDTYATTPCFEATGTTEN